MSKSLWAISDVHADFHQNLSFLRELSASPRRGDGLILAGDISHDFALLRETLTLLLRAFEPVFFVPGNHDLWIRNGGESAGTNSLERFERILSLCKSLGVRVGPSTFESAKGPVRVVPMFSWYVSHFEGMAQEETMDELYCRWPAGLGHPADYFCELSRRAIEKLPDDGTRVVTFSHFLPRPELLPSLTTPCSRALVAFAGDWRLDDLIRQSKSTTHVFGHSHGRIDRTIDGVRYLQNALGYPVEQGALGAPRLMEVEL